MCARGSFAWLGDTQVLRLFGWRLGRRYPERDWLYIKRRIVLEAGAYARIDHIMASYSAERAPGELSKCRLPLPLPLAVDVPTHCRGMSSSQLGQPRSHSRNAAEHGYLRGSLTLELKLGLLPRTSLSEDCPTISSSLRPGSLADALTRTAHIVDQPPSLSTPKPTETRIGLGKATPRSKPHSEYMAAR